MESNVKMYLKETGDEDVDLIHVAQSRHFYWAVPNMVKCLVP